MLLEQLDLGMTLFLCGDLAMLRCMLNCVTMDQCPWCTADPNRRLLPIVPFMHHIYDSDHLIAGVVLAMASAIWRRIPDDLRWHFEQHMRKAFPSWSASGQTTVRWRDVKPFIGWCKEMRENLSGTQFMGMIAVAMDYEFRGDGDDLMELGSRLLLAFHMLCSKTSQPTDHSTFVSLVSGLEQLWLDVFGDRRPVALHVLCKHWIYWFRLVKPHSVRTEGGERTNDEDNNSFFNATSMYAASFGQPGIGVKRMDAAQVRQWLTGQKFLSSVATLGHLDGRALCQLSRSELCDLSEDGNSIFDMLHLLRDGLDGLLGVNGGQWWVVKEKLNGCWPSE